MKMTYRLKFTAVMALLSTSLIFSPVQADAQLFKRSRPTRANMEKEIEILRFRVDSLQREIEHNSIPFADTISENDTINPGGISFFETEDLLDPSANTDSLLNLWYVQRSLTLDEGISVNLETDNLTSDTPDSVLIKRLKAINSFIPLPYNNIIKNHIIYYTQRIPNKIDLILGLSSYYLPIFEEIFDEHDMPKELKAMAIIESALNPVATSRVNARGIWQFMYRTARQYDLEITSYVDERLDPVASSHAAAKYLKDAYTIFGDWSLAIASYNCGAGNVNKAIRRAGGSRDFWTIYPYLPRETRGYVPSFVAALYTLAYYKDHGITPRQIAMPAHVDTFEIKKPLHFGQISELLGIAKEDIADLNPQYVKQIIPGSGNKPYLLRLPFNYTTLFVDNEKQIFTFKDSVYFNPIVLNEAKSASTQTATYHTVRRGETLSHIAQRYRVRLSDLQRWNSVRSNIRIGQRLVIYRNGEPSSSRTTASANPPSTTSSGGYLLYTVKKGDTLWEISRKFNGVTLNDIMRLNGFTKSSKILPGKKIRIKPL
ncbi:MAG: LysM peptidoglycan-binding domain-containing protein [Bacteroidales bacterium]|jgi:membrane-bound lytic murein transglycosylase D|nr:LysM peptidoglycan-binding domain-containing protein [Bacteroidales bacterium]